MPPSDIKAYRKRYSATNRRSINRTAQARYNANKDKFTAAARRYGKIFREKAKVDVIDHYGGECKCCGERWLGFLTIDHIDGGGRKHRVSVKSNFYAWLRRNNYPTGYQVLCFQCNCGRNINGGVCPHSTKEYRKWRKQYQ